jgi:hypothetical protein
MIVGAVLFVLQILVAAWLWWARARTPTVFALLAAQIGGGFIAFTSLIDLDDAMLYGQLLFQVAFTGCLAVGVATLGGRGQRVLGSGRRPTSARST